MYADVLNRLSSICSATAIFGVMSSPPTWLTRWDRDSSASDLLWKTV